MTALAILKIVGGFLKGNWKAVLVAAILGAALWIFFDWRAQAEEIAGLEFSLNREREMTEVWKETARIQSGKAKDAANQRAEFERRLAEELAKPPFVIFQPAEPEIHEIIIEAQECSEAVEKIGARLRELMGDRP